MEMSKNTKGRHTLRMKSLAALLPLLIAATSANAVQTGQITAGQGNISSNGPTTTVNQQSDRMIVHWNNFDIAAGEQVQFNQPSATSAVLNRVNSANATQIDGALNANGRVFVVNPNGIVVGKTGSINANGVVLSSLDIIFENSFMTSGLRAFTSQEGSAPTAVVNEGTINAGAAGVSLFGRQVINAASGNIFAKGNATDLTLINLVASNGLSAQESASTGVLQAYGYTYGSSYLVPGGMLANDGKIRAEIGDVELGVAALRDNASTTAFRNTGSVEATSGIFAGPFRPIEAGGNVRVYSAGDSNGTHVGGSINATYVDVKAQNDTVVDGTITAGGIAIDTTSPTWTRSTALTVADSANLNGGVIALSGDNVVVRGQATATQQATVTGRVHADVRQAALNAPSWQIDDGGRITTGSGQN